MGAVSLVPLQNCRQLTLLETLTAPVGSSLAISYQLHEPGKLRVLLFSAEKSSVGRKRPHNCPLIPLVLNSSPSLSQHCLSLEGDAVGVWWLLSSCSCALALGTTAASLNSLQESQAELEAPISWLAWFIPIWQPKDVLSLVCSQQLWQ